MSHLSLICSEIGTAGMLHQSQIMCLHRITQSYKQFNAAHQNGLARMRIADCENNYRLMISGNEISNWHLYSTDNLNHTNR